MHLKTLLEYLLKEETYGSQHKFTTFNPLTKLILNYVDDSIAEVEEAVEEQNMKAVMNIIRTYVQFIPPEELRSEAGITSKADLQRKLEPAIKGAAEAILTGIDLHESKGKSMKITKAQLTEMIRKLTKEVMKEQIESSGSKELSPALTRAFAKAEHSKSIELGREATSADDMADFESNPGLYVDSPDDIQASFKAVLVNPSKAGGQSVVRGWYLVKSRPESDRKVVYGPFESARECKSYAESIFGKLEKPYF